MLLNGLRAFRLAAALGLLASFFFSSGGVAFGADQTLDTDGDGLLDYLEDKNGNGLREASETDFRNVDTDLDGQSDSEELALGTNPLDAGSVSKTRLSYFRFNTSNLAGARGEVPLIISNVVSAPSPVFDGLAAEIPTNQPA